MQWINHPLCSNFFNITLQGHDKGYLTYNLLHKKSIKEGFTHTNSIKSCNKNNLS